MLSPYTQGYTPICQGPHQANLWVAASTETASELAANLDLVSCVHGGGSQSLQGCTHGVHAQVLVGWVRSFQHQVQQASQALHSLGLATNHIAVWRNAGAATVPACIRQRLTWASVFVTQNSTPCRLASFMRFTALLPPPPTPITCGVFKECGADECVAWPVHPANVDRCCCAEIGCACRASPQHA